MKIAFIGDSFTDGAVSYRNGVFYGYADITANRRHADYRKWVVYYFPAARVAWSEVVAYDPDIVVIELGIHIISGGDSATQTDAQIRAAVNGIINSSLAITDEVYYVLIPWRGWGETNNARAQLINQIIMEECGRLGVKTSNSWAAVEALGVAGIGFDGSHPTTEGHQLIADALLDAMSKKYYFPAVYR